MAVTPEKDGTGGLKLCFADIEIIAAGRAAPVNALGGVFLSIVAILPELFAGAGTLAASRAEMGGIGGACLEAEPRQGPRNDFGFGAQGRQVHHFATSSVQSSAAS